MVSYEPSLLTRRCSRVVAVVAAANLPAGEIEPWVDEHSASVLAERGVDPKTFTQCNQSLPLERSPDVDVARWFYGR